MFCTEPTSTCETKPKSFASLLCLQCFLTRNISRIHYTTLHYTTHTLHAYTHLSAFGFMAKLRTKFHMPISQSFYTYQQGTDKSGQFSYGRLFVTLHSTEVLPKDAIYFFSIHYHIPVLQCD
jgi:hypothetical protein